MKKKAFDCVEMKRRGAEKVQEQVKGMSAQEELDFWRRRTLALREKSRNTQASSRTMPSQ
jgi:hypothetical protein